MKWGGGLGNRRGISGCGAARSDLTGVFDWARLDLTGECGWGEGRGAEVAREVARSRPCDSCNVPYLDNAIGRWVDR